MDFHSNEGLYARAHVQRCPTPPMTCGKHLLSDPQPTFVYELVYEVVRM